MSGDYEPLDLAAWCDTSADNLGGERPTLGRVEYQGLPFLVGGTDGDPERCALAFGRGRREEPREIPVERTVRWVIVAHRVLEGDPMAREDLGEHVADYVFRFEGGAPVVAPIRHRFEIVVLPSTWGARPFRAYHDEKHGVLPRWEPWDRVSRRQTELASRGPRCWVLWPWRNPNPERRVLALEVRPREKPFAIGAITLGQLNEHPFARDAARPVRIVLPDPAYAARSFHLAVAVDRGVASYPWALPTATAEEFLADEFHGWGESQNPSASPAYVEVAATPSATLTVRNGDEELGRARFGDLLTGGVVAAGRVRLELVEEGRNWVETTIVDDATGLPVPCRVHFRSPAGVPYQPYGHHAHVNSNQPSWHDDVGGDLRLGQISYAYVDGRCEGWLPRGEVLVDVARGFEYEPLRARLRIEPGQRRLELRLKRWRDMNAAGWYSGDTHVHFLSTQGGHAEARGEDLNVVNLLLSQWGHLFTNSEEFTGMPSVSGDGRTIVYASQENRQHMFGHLCLLGLKEQIRPWCTDGPAEAALGGALETTMADWADRCRAQGGTVVIAHHPDPNGEASALIATGRADAAEICENPPLRWPEYYKHLNCGYRLPLVGGTDKMSSDTPVGIYRTYVRVPSDEGFTYDAWCRNLRRGRTFLSGGPLLRFSVEGREIGDTLELPAGGGTVEVEAEADSIFPIHCLEVVERGRVVARTEEERGTRSLRIRTRLRLDRHTWLAARVGGPGGTQMIHHRDSWRRDVWAHTSPIYVAVGGDWWLFEAGTARYMLTLVEGALTYIRETSLQYPAGTALHHHGEADHLAFLERPFLEAREALHRRLHAAGVPH